jgi:nucleoside-diphosphate-sugar epimerase
MKILVIGGTCLTGPHIVRRLAEGGREVTVFHRGQHTVSLPPGVRALLGDKEDLGALDGAVKAAAPEVVLDMCALTEEHAIGLMETCRGIARRVVVISSIDVYRAYARIHRFEPGPPDPVPLAEDAPLREKLDPRAGLRYNKTAVERVIMSDPSLPGTVLRYPAVLGAGDYQHRLFGTLKRMDDGRPFILLEEAGARHRFSHGYAEDLAVGAALAVTNERAADRIYNVAERETPSSAERVRRIAAVTGWKGEVLSLPMDQLPPHLHHEMDLRQHWVVDTTRIRQELGYAEVVPEDEALRRTIEWERANPPEKVDPAEFDYAAEDAAFAVYYNA